jgi:hypothetical protein
MVVSACLTKIWLAALQFFGLFFFKRFLRLMKDFKDEDRTPNEMSENSEFFGELEESVGVLISSTEIQYMDETDFVEGEGVSN